MDQILMEIFEMFSGVCFVGGIYGVGKNTLCQQISQRLNVPFYSAGDLISCVNGEQYGSSKVVADKFLNQKILISEVNKKLRCNKSLLLAGHFCILDGRNEVDRLPGWVFDQLAITKIILLEASAKKIQTNLLKRDMKEYPITLIEKLLKSERSMAQEVADELGCELLIQKLHYDSSDDKDCVRFLQE